MKNSLFFKTHEHFECQGGPEGRRSCIVSYSSYPYSGLVTTWRHPSLLVRACVRACVRVCAVHACVRACSTREKYFEILRHGMELNPGHREDRQWNRVILPLTCHDWLLCIIPQFISAYQEFLRLYIHQAYTSPHTHCSVILIATLKPTHVPLHTDLQSLHITSSVSHDSSVGYLTVLPVAPGHDSSVGCLTVCPPCGPGHDSSVG